MNTEYAKVICDSVAPNGRRLISVEARYWRAIHAEVMTHRDRARNAASSRAIPFFRRGKDGTTIVKNCTYSYICTDSFFPEFIGTEQTGMQSGGELNNLDRGKALRLITEMRDYSLRKCLELYELGVHKSIINRYLEPWSYITVLMTATEWKNFFRLRVHPKAEKHFNKIATMIQDVINKSVPLTRNVGQWHLPYIDAEDWERTDNLTEREQIWALKRVSAGRCARLSFLTHEGKRDLSADIGIFNKLIHPKLEDERDDDVIHSSPLEHVATPDPFANFRSGPFVGWQQFRKEFPNENVEG